MRGNDVVNKAFVYLYPFAHGEKIRLFAIGNKPVAHKPRVKKQIAIELAAIDKHFHEFFRGLHADILFRVSPVIGESLAHLAGKRLFGRIDEKRLSALESHAVYLAMSRFSAFAQPRVVDNHRFRLIFSYSAVNTVLLPVVVRLIPHSVEPETADFAVLRA